MSRTTLKFSAVFGTSLARAFAAPSAAAGVGAAPRRRLHSLRMLAYAQAAWRWMLKKRQAQQGSRKLQLLETLQLGEKRFIAMIDAGGARYLVGGGAGQVQLLTRLDDACNPLSGGPVPNQTSWERP